MSNIVPKRKFKHFRRHKTDKIDPHQIEALMRLKPSLEDTAAFFNVSTKTIERYIKMKWGQTFVPFREERMVQTRLELRRELHRQALKGNTAALIFALKNFDEFADKQSDKLEITATQQQQPTLVIEYSNPMPDIEIVANDTSKV
jgi:AraC-like DNA-binding protein